MVLGAKRLFTDRGVDGKVEQGLRNLVAVRAPGLLDALGKHLHRNIAGDRPRGGVLLLGIGLQPLDIVLVRRRSVRPVVDVVGVSPDPDRIFGAHRSCRFDRGRLAGADEVVLDGIEIAERLGLLGEGEEVPAPQRGEHCVRLLAHLRVDERRVIGLAELRPLLVDDLDIGLDLLEMLDEGLRHVLAVGVIGADRRNPLQPPFGDDLGSGTALDRGVRGGAEHVRMQVRRSGELIGLRDRRDEDDLVVLGDRRDRRTFRRSECADEEIDVVFENELARDAHGLVGVALRVSQD